MVKILSFDVGIKNLAYCLVEFEDNKSTILDWGVIDIMERFRLECPITMEIPKDPILCLIDGRIYEKDALKKALDTKYESPMTREKIQRSDSFILFDP